MTTRTTLTYALLFVALLVQPHVLQGHVLFLTSAWAQTIATAAILGMAAGTYVLHQLALRRAERRSATLREEKRRANEKLLESFRYIGIVNGRLPLLQEVTTDVLRGTPHTSRGRRATLQKLLALAVVSTARAPWGHLRFVDRSSGRTVGEFSVARDGARVPPAPIGNAELLTIASSSEQGQGPSAENVRSSTDQWAPHQTFLILGPHPAEARDADTLQALVDQAHILFAYFSAAPPSRGQISPRLPTTLATVS